MTCTKKQKGNKIRFKNMEELLNWININVAAITAIATVVAAFASLVSISAIVVQCCISNKARKIICLR